MLRKKNWIRVIALALLLAPVFALVWGFGIEPGRLVVRHSRMELAGWRGDLRIAVLSDLHIGSPHVGLDKLQKIVERTNAENPALVVLLGDFVIGGPGGRHDANFVEPEQIAAGLKKLRAPLGVFAVLGNHDWWYDGQRVGKALTGAGIHVLENEAAHVGPIWLGGIADFWTREPDIAGTLRQVTTNDPVVLITHNPDIFPEIPPNAPAVPPRVSLMLAAHTHGGQVQLPVVGTLITPSQRGYVGGEYVREGRHLFVTTGIGTSIMPVRFGVPPEIVILTVAPAKP